MRTRNAQGFLCRRTTQRSAWSLDNGLGVSNWQRTKLVDGDLSHMGHHRLFFFLHKTQWKMQTMAVVMTITSCRYP